MFDSNPLWDAFVTMRHRRYYPLPWSGKLSQIDNGQLQRVLKAIKGESNSYLYKYVGCRCYPDGQESWNDQYRHPTVQDFNKHFRYSPLHTSREFGVNQHLLCLLDNAYTLYTDDSRSEVVKPYTVADLFLMSGIMHMAEIADPRKANTEYSHIARTAVKHAQKKGLIPPLEDVPYIIPSTPHRLVGQDLNPEGPAEIYKDLIWACKVTIGLDLKGVNS